MFCTAAIVRMPCPTVSSLLDLWGLTGFPELMVSYTADNVRMPCSSVSSLTDVRRLTRFLE